MAPTAPTFWLLSAPRAPVTALSADALAAFILRQRPGRTPCLRPAMASVDGGDDFPAVAVFAVEPRAARQFTDDPAAFNADYLGHAAGPGADHPLRLQAAVDRVRSAGGLAA